MSNRYSRSFARHTRALEGRVSHRGQIEDRSNQGEKDEPLRDILATTLLVTVLALVPVVICSRIPFFAPYVGALIWAIILLTAAAVTIMTVRLAIELQREARPPTAANHEDFRRISRSRASRS